MNLLNIIKVDQVKIHIELFSSGYCTASTRYTFPGEPAVNVNYCATWAYIVHPQIGNILFDTGYASRFFDATETFPERIYRWITPVYHKPEESCLNQLRKKGVDPQKIEYIVISHFHADHIGGLHDFPGATFLTSEKGLDYALNRSPLTSVFKGVLKSLIPNDIRTRTVFPEKNFTETTISGLRAWKWKDDLWFVDLPGHYRGQIGLLLKNTNLGDILLCSDAVWSGRAISEKIYPSRMVSLISDNYNQLCETIDNLHIFQAENKDVIILPAHCDHTTTFIKEQLEV